MRGYTLVRTIAAMQAEQRQLGWAAAVAVVTGESIALGIFLTPATMARSLASPGLLAVVWCGMGLMALAGALCYSALAVRFPRSGGEYVYLREGYGERVAFLYGWMSAAVMDPGLAAALAVGAGSYAAAIFALPPTAAALAPAVLLLLLAGVNLLGTRLSARLMTAANLSKLLVLFALVAWSFLARRGSMTHLEPFWARHAGNGATGSGSALEPIFGAVVGAVMNAFFSFGGWWEAGKIAGEIRDPERNLPRAFLGGVALVTAIYLLISFAFLYVVPPGEIVSNTAFVAQFGKVLFGQAGGTLLSACVLLSVIGGLSAMTMAAPRVYLAMAQDGNFFPIFARRERRFGSPVYGIALQTGLAVVLLTLGAFDRILAYIIFSAVIFLGLSVATLFRMRPAIRAWWFPAAPLVFLLGCAAIAVLILLHDPLPALLGAGIVAGGGIVRFALLPRANREKQSISTPILEEEA